MRLISITALAFLLVAPLAFADVIELKTGQRVEGTLKQATPAGVSIEVGGQTITFEGERVRAIYFGTAPAPIVAQPTPRDEAMKALRGLRSVTEGGINQRDYAPRASDAKIVVDRYRADVPADVARDAISESPGFYVFAATAWNA